MYHTIGDGFLRNTKTLKTMTPRDLLEKQIVLDAVHSEDTTVLAELLSLLTDEQVYNALSDGNQEHIGEPKKVDKNQVYYQPIMTDAQWDEHRNFNSFDVYLSFHKAKQDFPDCEIGAYSGDDIENPTYVDMVASSYLRMKKDVE